MDYKDVTLGELILVVSALVAFIKFLEWLWDKFINPHLKREQVMTQTEKDIKDIKEMLKNDYQKLQDHDTRLKRLEDLQRDSEEDRKELHESFRVTMVALQALLKSRLENDNNIDGIQNAEREIEHYMRSKL